MPTAPRFPFLDPELDRAALLPVALDPQGERVLAVPGLAAEVLQALTLPERAARGEIDPTSERGVQEAAVLGGAVTLAPIRGPVAALGSRAIVPRRQRGVQELFDEVREMEVFEVQPRTPQATLVASNAEEALTRASFLLRPERLRTASQPNFISSETGERFAQFLSRNRWTVSDAVAARKVFTDTDADYVRRLNDTLRDIEFGKSAGGALEETMASIVQEQIASFLEKLPRPGEGRAGLASRLRRRKESGFEQTFFHGTEAKTEFSFFNKPTQDYKERAVFLSPSRDVAKFYGQRVMELTVRADNPTVIDLAALRGRPMHYEGNLVRETIKAAEEANKDVVVLQNIRDVGGLQDQVLVLDPSKIRSTSAEFSDLTSSDILSGFAGAAVAAPFVMRALTEPSLGDTELPEITVSQEADQ